MKKNSVFEKFASKEPTGAKKKEAIRQEKRKAKQEIRAFHEERKRIIREQGEAAFKSMYEKPKPRFKKEDGFESKTYPRKSSFSEGGNFKPAFKKSDRFESKSFAGKSSKTYDEKRKERFDQENRIEKKPYNKTSSFSHGGNYSNHVKKTDSFEPRTYKKSFSNHTERTEKPTRFEGKLDERKPFDKPKRFSTQRTDSDVNTNKKYQQTPSQAPTAKVVKKNTEEMPLNKFVAHAGVCSRRDAVGLIKAGKVKVNQEIIFEPAHKVLATDLVTFDGKKLYSQKNLVYILLNKPKDYITTVSDPQNRKTVLDLVKQASKERLFPVGRLDRNTTGVLLLTNDGELTQKLTHPSFEIKKIYEVKLDRPLTKKDAESIASGIELEDGFIAVDSIGFVDSKDKSIIGVEIHSGRNRIVRRIFEHLGYDVRGLDRVMFANLTKKNVDRGKWRFLTEKEVRILKYLNQSYTKAK